MKKPSVWLSFVLIGCGFTFFNCPPDPDKKDAGIDAGVDGNDQDTTDKNQGADDGSVVPDEALPDDDTGEDTTDQNLPTNHPPVAQNLVIKVYRNWAKKLTLTATDEDGDPLLFATDSQPEHGQLSGQDLSPYLVYTPDTDYLGEDSFIFHANDIQANSNFATVTLQVVEPIWYVDQTAAEALDDTDLGMSWEKAFHHPQEAFLISQAGNQIWVKAGTYTRRPQDLQNLVLVAGVAMYGGFAGTETDLAERDPEANVTILSGESSYRVATGTPNARLDGFTLQDGLATGNAPANQGGGLFFICDPDAYPSGCAMTVANCIFKNNQATYGGAVYMENATATFSDSVFTYNTTEPADGWGGAITAIKKSLPVFVRCVFDNNSAGRTGGAIYDDGASSPTLASCLFEHNWANNGGAIVNANNSSPIVTNCTFFGNLVTDPGNTTGESIANLYGSSPVIKNCLFWGGFSESGGEIHDCNNTCQTSITYSYVEGGTNSVDPLFVREGTLNNNGTPADPDDDFWEAGDYQLTDVSPAIDVGDDTAAPLTDLNGLARVDLPDVGTEGTLTDLGALEYQFP